MTEKREKFYTVSARLVFSTILILIIVGLLLGASIIINKGPIIPLLGVIGPKPTVVATGYVPSTSIVSSPGLVVNATCFGLYTYKCENPVFNYTTGILTIAISQSSGYNWTSVTVRFVPSNAIYSHGVPELSWSPPGAVNVTGGLLNDTVRYVNIPITSGPVSVGTNITGSIWAKYELNVGGGVSYANMSTAFIVIKQ
ncbi:MAG: hypothetical protein ABR981_01635 [Candidatus Micrarchaeaceae archaeon]|jgi:hypothetical protein